MCMFVLVMCVCVCVCVCVCTCVCVCLFVPTPPLLLLPMLLPLLLPRLPLPPPLLLLLENINISLTKSGILKDTNSLVGCICLVSIREYALGACSAARLLYVLLVIVVLGGLGVDMGWLLGAS